MEVGRGWPCSQQMDAGEEAPASGRNSERRQKTLGAGRRREKEEVWRRRPPVLEPRGALQAFRRSSGLQEVLRSLRGLQVFKKLNDALFSWRNCSQMFSFSLEEPLQSEETVGHVSTSATRFRPPLLGTVRLGVVVSTATWS